MKKYFVVVLILVLGAIANAQPSPPFYIVNVAAVKTQKEAVAKTKELSKKGYRANYLWIPDYASLSGARYFSVYIGPFRNQYDCEVATEEYRKKNPSAYGLLVSHQSRRVQITGIGKVTGSGSAKRKAR